MHHVSNNANAICAEVTKKQNDSNYHAESKSAFPHAIFKTLSHTTCCLSRMLALVPNWHRQCFCVVCWWFGNFFTIELIIMMQKNENWLQIFYEGSKNIESYRVYTTSQQKKHYNGCLGEICDSERFMLQNSP